MEGTHEKPQEIVMVKCKNCHGSGTIFPSKVFKIGNSKRCPVCKGTCWVPAKESGK